jgi:hypothetical protein
MRQAASLPEPPPTAEAAKTMAKAERKQRILPGPAGCSSARPIKVIEDEGVRRPMAAVDQPKRQKKHPDRQVRQCRKSLIASIRRSRNLHFGTQLLIHTLGKGD